MNQDNLLDMLLLTVEQNSSVFDGINTIENQKLFEELFPEYTNKRPTPNSYKPFTPLKIKNLVKKNEFKDKKY